MSVKVVQLGALLLKVWNTVRVILVREKPD
ncbi:hypothetical protein FHS94_001417 [Sphingomonas aerophila]|uniref:Uncharacterized protein n=1 Tax=Sphingomonas aerophila TaxID=1344948 RepID=A0A7W9BCY9_9SPHN|nr:hypothetical protein [Sphingomonas aerophila]